MRSCCPRPEPERLAEACRTCHRTIGSVGKGLLIPLRMAVRARPPIQRRELHSLRRETFFSVPPPDDAKLAEAQVPSRGSRHHDELVASRQQRQARHATLIDEFRYRVENNV